MYINIQYIPIYIYTYILYMDIYIYIHTISNPSSFLLHIFPLVLLKVPKSPECTENIAWHVEIHPPLPPPGVSYIANMAKPFSRAIAKLLMGHIRGEV
jgi:hypothetical protein